MNKVLHGDCLELMKSIPDGSVDMILCDLPYGTTACKWDVIIPFEPLWEQYKRVIKKNGAIVLTASQPFTTDLINSNRKMFRYCFYWQKNRPTGFANSKKQPLRDMEDIPVFYSSLPVYNPQGLLRVNKVGRNSVSSGGDSLRGDTKKSEGKGSLRTPGKEFISEFANYPRQTISISSDTYKVHPTQKPVALFEYLIKTYTNEGETVLDNCAGSGTTAIACINTNRNYILMEKEDKYYNLILDRIEKHQPQLKIAI